MKKSRNRTKSVSRKKNHCQFAKRPRAHIGKIFLQNFMYELKVRMMKAASKAAIGIPVIRVRNHAIPVEHARNALLGPVSIRQLRVHEETNTSLNSLNNVCAGCCLWIGKYEREQSPSGAYNMTTFAVPVLLTHAALIAFTPATIGHLLGEQKSATFVNQSLVCLAADFVQCECLDAKPASIRETNGPAAVP